MISFKALTAKDKDQLHAWLQLPHIREFWDDGDRTTEQVHSHYFQADQVKRYIVFIDKRPAGYIQSYVVDAKHEYKECTLPNETTLGIDYFIGNSNFLGRGFAIPILKDFIKMHCHAKNILVDPFPHNHKAIHIYKKIGFIKIGTQIINNQSHEIMLYSNNH